jgi:hypothetical protein
MKKGQKLKRICSDCKQLKEQVKDGMRQKGNGTWRCDTCSQIAWAKIREVFNQCPFPAGYK